MFYITEYNIDITTIKICIWEFYACDFPSIELSRDEHWGYSIAPVIEKNQIVNFMLMRTRTQLDTVGFPPYPNKQALTFEEIISISEKELNIKFTEEILNKFISILTICTMNGFKKGIIERQEYEDY